MRTRRRFLSCLLAASIAATMCSSAFAVEGQVGESASDSSVHGLEMSKAYDSESGKLTLEAYVTGESQTVITKQPVDIALVLDISGSMDEEITVGNGTDVLDVLDSQYGGAEGIYTMQIADKLGVTRRYDLRYRNGQWQYNKIRGGWTNLIGSGYESNTKQTYITKLNALKIATQRFIDSAQTSSDPSDPNRIAIISYATRSRVDMDLTAVDAAGAQELKNTVTAFTAGGGTRSDLGMQDAQSVFTGNDNHKKVTIMFTDGIPGPYGDWTQSSTMDAANNTIDAAKTLKDNDTTVYTIGCFSAEPAETSNTGKYMNYVSSNYPDATNMNAGGSKVDSKYYKSAQTSSDLNEIFQSISQETGGATYTLKSEAVLKDVVSEYFDLPANAADVVTVHTETCTAIDADGNPTAWKNDNNSNEYSANVDVATKTITVTGFDYSANWVGSHSGTAGGKKLVVEIPIQDNGTGYGTVPTNTAESGIYPDSSTTTPVGLFEIPTHHFPYYEIHHVQNGTDVKNDKFRIVTVKLTDQTSEGFLYGGSFTDPACTTPISQNGASEFTPEDGAVFYIWEVNTNYLSPRNYTVWKHTGNPDGSVHVIALYPLTTVDRLNYQEVGFIVDNQDIKSDGSHENGKELGESTVYGAIQVMQSDKLYDCLYVGADGTLQAAKSETTSAGGYIGICKTAQFNKQNDTVAFQPYWITLDGVKVTGTHSRTATHKGIGMGATYQTATVTDTPTGSKVTPTANTPSIQALHSLAVYRLNADIESAEPVEPSKPDTVTITVHDKNTVYDVNVKKGEDVKLTCKDQHMLFSGWFTDEALTQAANLTNIQSDLTVYAKYVDHAYLQVKYVQNLFRTKVYLMSAIDGDYYNEVGFLVNGEKVDATVYSRYSGYTARTLFGHSVDKQSRLIAGTYSIKGMKRGGKLTVQPYWITADGTEVLGSERVLTYSWFGLR